MWLAVEVALRSRPRKIHNIVFLGGDSKVGELRRYVLSELGKDNASETARAGSSSAADASTRRPASACTACMATTAAK